MTEAVIEVNSLAGVTGSFTDDVTDDVSPAVFSGMNVRHCDL